GRAAATGGGGTVGVPERGLGVGAGAGGRARGLGVGTDGFSTFVSGLGSGSSLTSGRGLSTGGVGTATGSGGAATGTGRSHQKSTLIRRTAFTASAASRRPGVGLHADRGRGAGDRSRCTTGACRSRCWAAFVSASRM